MAPLRPGWSFLRSMAECEKYFGTLLRIKPGSRVADLGMGIGGPMRRIVEFFGAYVSGCTICKYQVDRANTITSKMPKFFEDHTEYHVGDYNDLPKEAFKKNSFDVAYFMESL